MEYIIYVGSGDYLQSRGGNDWGRCNEWEATPFDSYDLALEYARKIVGDIGFRVEKYDRNS